MARQVVAGRYRLVDRLGVSVMSEVWLAEDLELGREVAFKRLGPGADPARFAREAHAAAALAHPHICRLYDYGQVDGGTFMVLEYLPGGTLGDRLEPGRPVPDEEAARIMSEVAEGLAYAHAQGLVHRDLKPANILFDAEGRAKLCDFGIARQVDASTLTEAGTLLGTAAYMSPEQAWGESATPASDVYSVGVIAYQMLAGRLPFESGSVIELARKHRELAPPPLASVRPGVPRALVRVTMTALAKDPRARPADGAALVEKLRRSDPAMVAPAEAPTQVAEPHVSRASRWRWLAAALAMTMLLAGGLALALVLDRGTASQPSPVTTPARPRPASEPSQSVGTGAASTHVRTGTATTAKTATTGRSTTGATATAPGTTAPTSTSATTTASTTAPTSTATTSSTTTTPTPTGGTTG